MSSEAATYFPDALSQMAAERQEPNAAAECSPTLVCAAAKLQISKTDNTDEQLLTQVGLGSQEALGLLFRRHGRAVFNTARRILRDHSEADDLRQDVFVYLFEKANDFDSEKGSAASWIIQIAYHRAIDRRRYLDSRHHYSSQELDEEKLPANLGQPSTDTIDGKALLNRVREQLSVDQLQTLELHFFEGYSLREIAEKSGQTVGNVRHHYYRALERLRSSLFPEKRD
jgi:RNA polymerase sigma-70 factor (ECF subfamily)